MERVAVQNIREALVAARQAAQTLQLDSCDMDDLEEVIQPAEAELETNMPNVLTLATYLNSLARSLRSAPGARTAVLRLDAAMREAGVPTTWEK